VAAAIHPQGEKGRLQALVTVLLVALVPAYFILVSDPRVDTVTRGWGSILWMLCFVPSFVYFALPRAQRPGIPLLPVVGVLYGFYYALPLISPTGTLNDGDKLLDLATEFRTPVVLALVGWALMLVTYYTLGATLRGRLPAVRSSGDVQAMRKWGMLILYGGLAIDLAQRAVRVPAVVQGLLNFSVTLGWLGAGLLTLLAVRGQLTGVQRLAALLGMLALAGIHLASGLASNLAFLGAVVFLAVWIGKGGLGRRWLVLLLLAVGLILAWRSVTPQFRVLAWYTQHLSTTERVEVAVELLSDRVKEEGLVGAAMLGLEASGRWGTLDMFADVTRVTPARVPHWNGYSYLSLVGVAVPRVIWPSKPEKALGQDFGHRYGYISPHDTATSVNLPFLIEFYINFGTVGVMLGMMLVGVIYRSLEALLNRPGQSELLAVAGIVLMVPLFNLESDFSLVFGGLLLNGVAVWAVLQLIKMDSKPEPRQVPASGLHPPLQTA
jgi:hypothetical protein